MDRRHLRILVWDFLLINCTLLFFAPYSYGRDAGKGNIKGTVTTTDSKPAGYVSVVLKGTKKTVLTAEDGSFLFSNVPAGDYELQVSLVGYTPVVRPVKVENGQVVIINLQLTVSDQQLQEVVVNAGSNKFGQKESPQIARLPLKNLENPQVYSVVTKDLIKEQVTTDVGEALRNIPGALAIKAGGGSSGIMSRGFATYANLRNGLNTSAIGPEDPVNLERIESIKGPSGTLFGNVNTSFGGLVNYITKKPFDSFKGEVSYTTGSWQLSRLTADVNTPLNNSKTLLLRTTAALQSQNTFQDQGFSKSYTFAPKLTYQVNDRLTLHLETEIVGQKWNASASSGATIGTGVTAKSFKGLPLPYDRTLIGNAVYDENGITSVFAQADYKLSDSWTSQTNYSFSEGHYDLYNYITYNWLNDNTVVRQIGYWQPNKFGNIEFQQNFIGDFKLGSLRNRVVIGLDYSRYYYLLNRSATGNYDTVNVQVKIPEISTSGLAAWAAKLNYTYSSYARNIYSAYASDVLNLTDNLLVMLSLRLDRNQTGGSYNGTTGLSTGKYGQTALSPKLGIVYEPVKDVVSLFANYMNGFQNVAPAASGPNGDLKSFKPQQANQWEAGTKLELFKGRLSSTISYYNININNATYADPNNAAYTIQDGTQRSKGFEIEAIANPVSGLNVVAGYGNNENKYTRSSKGLEGKLVTGAPKNIGNLWASYKLTNGKAKGLGIGAGGNYVSDAWYNATNTFTLPGYTLLNATVFYEQSRYSLNIKLNNILNKKYWNTSGNPQSSLNVAIGGSFRF